jgi:hypothetical protein
VTERRRREPPPRYIRRVRPEEERDAAAAEGALRDRRRALAEAQQELAATRERVRRTYGLAGTVSALGLFGACMLAALLPSYLALHGTISQRTASWLIPTLVLSSFAVGLLAILRWQSGGRAAAAAASAAADGFATFTAPTRAPVSPPEIERAVRELDRERRHTRLATLAAERSAIAGMPSAMGHLDLVIGGSLLLPLSGASLVLSIRMLAGLDAYERTIWLLWALSLGGAGALVALRRHKARRRLGFQRALDALGARMGGSGRRLRGFADAVDWMNQFWAAPLDANGLHRGAINVALAATQRRYPVLVDVEPDGYSTEDGTIDGRVFVYVAALAPRGLPATPEVAELTAAVRRAGFEAELFSNAGLLARATAPTLQILRREPQRLAQLGPLIDALVEMAEACRAAPATAD